MKYLTLLIATITILYFSACTNDHNTEERSHSHGTHEHGDEATHVHEHEDYEEHSTNPEQEEYEVVPDSGTVGQELQQHSDEHEHEHKH